MVINKEYYGTTKSGREVSLYWLENRLGMRASFLDFGAIWVNMMVPDKGGMLRDVVLHHKGIRGYETNPSFFGAYVGRVANRTEGARFTLDGVEYRMEKNEGDNNLHTSAADGLHKRMWSVVQHDKNSIELAISSPDGDYGLPGKMDINLTYTLTDDGRLCVGTRAVCDKRSIINVTCHAYFNLNGVGNGNCLDTKLMINGDEYTPITDEGIPTGEILSVENTPFDFRKMKPIGRDIFADNDQLTMAKGYDHNFVIKGDPRQLRLVAEAYSEESGIRLTTYHDQPGLQFYSGNYIGVLAGEDEVATGDYSAFCLEANGFANAINTPEFPSPIIEAGQEYDTNVVFRFSK